MTIDEEFQAWIKRASPGRICGNSNDELWETVRTAIGTEASASEVEACAKRHGFTVQSERVGPVEDGKFQLFVRFPQGV